MLIRLLIFVLVAYMIYRVLKSWLGATPPPRVKSAGRSTPLQADDVMIQDPQCGVYFARRDAVPLQLGGQTLYFCSQECKDKYLVENKV